MGEIATRRIRRTAHSVLLVGQAPGADGDVRPLTGTMGVRLADLMGFGVGGGARVPSVPPYRVPTDEVVGLYFDRANVLDFYPGRSGKGHAFPLGHARVAAQAMWPRLLEYERVLFCGRAVYDVFRTCQHDGVNLRRKEWRHRGAYAWTRHREMVRAPDDSAALVGFDFAWMHHTSMIVPWWNDPANVDKARRFLTDLANWTIWGREEEAA